MSRGSEDPGVGGGGSNQNDTIGFGGPSLFLVHGPVTFKYFLVYYIIVYKMNECLTTPQLKI